MRERQWRHGMTAPPESSSFAFHARTIFCIWTVVLHCSFIRLVSNWICIWWICIPFSYFSFECISMSFIFSLSLICFLCMFIDLKSICNWWRHRNVLDIIYWTWHETFCNVINVFQRSIRIHTLQVNVNQRFITDLGQRCKATLYCWPRSGWLNWLLTK